MGDSAKRSGGDLWVMAAHSHHYPSFGDTGMNSESIPASTTDAPRLVFPWLSVTSSRRPLSAVKACQCRPRSHRALVSCIVLPSPFASQVRFLRPSSSTLKDVKPFSSPMSRYTAPRGLSYCSKTLALTRLCTTRLLVIVRCLAFVICRSVSLP